MYKVEKPYAKPVCRHSMFHSYHSYLPGFVGLSARFSFHQGSTPSLT